MSLFSLKNKVAIVTGAGGLLGQQHCRALASAKATIVAIDICPLEKLKYIEQLDGKNHLIFQIDITDKKALLNCCKKIINKLKAIDILVNNAAINDRFEHPDLAKEQSRFENYPLDMWQKSIDVNLTGLFLCSQVFGTAMLDNKEGGSIINIASTYGMVGPDQDLYIDDIGQQIFYKSPAYPTTKGAVINFTRYLAAYWGNKKIRVNTLSPGGVKNGQDSWFVENYSRRTALKRMATPEDYQGALIFLASNASAYMTGANLTIDGGWTAV